MVSFPWDESGRCWLKLGMILLDRGYILFPRKKLETQLKAYLIHVPEMPDAIDIEPDKVLNDTIAQHGLFIEQARRFFSFSHLTFQEYFTAKYIVENVNAGTIEELVGHTFEGRWHEVFLLVCQLVA